MPFISGEVKEIEIVHLGQEPGIAEMTAVETEWNGQNAYLILLHNITERKRMEEQLERSAKEWEITFDSISDMISIHDKDFKITRANKTLAETLKKDPEEIIGQTCYELFHGMKEPIQNCPHLQCLETKEPAMTEIFEPRLNAYLNITTSPILDENGEVKGSVHIVRDITEQKLAEKKLTEANVKLKEYNKLKDEFISTTSHELRTPLSIIMGAIRLVLDEIPGKIVSEQREVLVMAAENLQRLARIVDSLLSISRIESGKLGLEKINVNICQLIENTVSHYKNFAQEKEISLECEVPTQEMLIPLDPDRIQEVLINLFSNSFKFTPKGGTVKVTCWEENDGISFSVQDSGRGIAKKDMPNLFDKFTQFSRKAGPGEKGTGLGLAIVKGLVEMHGGTIEAKSKINKGTTFTVFLPFTSQYVEEELSEKADKIIEREFAGN
ncbi:MAG: PAS domain-containing sensor histidine kinase [Planctomycetes bacterium]|nr:PAS domain-containing sensor histidine kinase [Planctomycetota bacterium]